MRSAFRTPHFKTVGKTGVEPAFSCFRRTRPLHLVHFPKLPTRVPGAGESTTGFAPATSRSLSECSTIELRVYAPVVGRGQSVRRDSNPRVLGGNQAGYRSPHERFFRVRSSECGTRNEELGAVSSIPNSALPTPHFPSPGGWSRTSSSAFSARRFNRVSFTGDFRDPTLSVFNFELETLNSKLSLLCPARGSNPASAG